MLKKFNLSLGLSAVILATGAVWFYGFQAKPCPDQYVLLPGKNLCIAKYEMRKGMNDKATSTSEGPPWININHDEALLACEKNGPGYDLISNSNWTAVARDIADTASNWSTGAPYHGVLNMGHSNGKPDRFLEASSDDNQACYQTGEDCSLKKWNSQRRTHFLSNGEVIWDFSGNLAEWIKDINDKKQIEAPQGYIGPIDHNDLRYQKFGPLKQCESDSTGQQHCGLGYYWTHDVHRNGIGRSGFWKHNSPFMAGIFSLGIDVILERKYNFMGFRCVYNLNLLSK